MMMAFLHEFEVIITDENGIEYNYDIEADELEDAIPVAREFFRMDYGNLALKKVVNISAEVIA